MNSLYGLKRFAGKAFASRQGLNSFVLVLLRTYMHGGHATTTFRKIFKLSSKQEASPRSHPCSSRFRATRNPGGVLSFNFKIKTSVLAAFVPLVTQGVFSVLILKY